MPTLPPTSSAQVLPLRRRGDHQDAVRIAIDWLTERHRKGWHNTFEAQLELLWPEKHKDRHLEQDALEMLAVNVGEWLLARGEIFVKGEMRSINEHLLGRDGPYLTPGQQHWIAQLHERPLRLYRVTDVRVGEGLTLVDELDLAAEPLVVQERSGSRDAQPGMLMGARVMHLEDHLELSGAIYPFTKLHESSVVAQVRAALDAGLHPQNNLELAEMAIARSWLTQWLEPAPMPELRDAGTGEPLLLVTDHYRVLDAAALASALAAQPDVSGSPEEGWHRESDAGGGMVRSLVAINPGKAADRLHLFYRTQGLADEGRTWFDALAGAAVRHTKRVITDPRSPAALSGASRKSGPAPELEPEAMAQLMEQALRGHYARWADEPIPALGGQTPRQAIATAGGLERVKGLMREYEAGEAAMAKRDGRREVSFQFLWDALGIAR